MSKRFTETCKWDDPWFRKLKPVAKLLFLYMCDRCDNAGFWEIDLADAAYRIGCRARTLEAAYQGLARGLVIGQRFVWIRNFLKHQKNLPLNPNNPAHRGIQKILDAHIEKGLSRGLVAPSEGLASPIGKGIGIGIGIGKKKGECEGGTFLASLPEEPYGYQHLLNDEDYKATMMMEPPYDSDEALRTQAAMVWAHYKTKFRYGQTFIKAKAKIIPLLEVGATIEDCIQAIQKYKGKSDTPIWRVLKPLEDEVERRAQERAKEERDKERDERIAKKCAELEAENG